MNKLEFPLNSKIYKALGKDDWEIKTYYYDCGIAHDFPAEMVTLEAREGTRYEGFKIELDDCYNEFSYRIIAPKSIENIITEELHDKIKKII